MNKTYVLKPTMTFHTLAAGAGSDKPGLPPHPNTPQARAARQLAQAIAPTPAPSAKTLVLDGAAVPAAPVLPRRQPLPSPVLYPDKKTLKLGLDVHLDFLMAVVQRDHASPQAPRKMTPDQLIEPVQKWVAQGLVVYAVQEYGHQKLPSRWWGPRLWKRLSAKLDPWILGVLEKLREILLVIEAQVAALDAELAAGTALKKKTIVALARQLAVDLWRWRTGRCTMADLGWVAA